MASVLASTITVDVEELEDVIRPEDACRTRAPQARRARRRNAGLARRREIPPWIDAIYCEVSFVELYKLQPTAGAIVTFLDGHGFALRGAFNLSHTRQFGPTQADLLFIKL